MAIGIPANFQAISNVLANYNFVDIASGTGYINFYAGTTVDLKVLSNFVFYSDVIRELVATTHGTADVLIFDHDFDTILNRPLDVKGLGILNVPVFVNLQNVMSVYVIAYLRKWDGVTETDIATNTSRVFSSASANSYSMLSIDLNIPLTHFKIGETLRLTIKLYASNSNSSGDTNTVAYAHDPKGRTTGWDTTGAVPSQLMFQCPVRLNL